jgi:DNA-binding winged helix-turn-helix (wHTH) protein
VHISRRIAAQTRDEASVSVPGNDVKNDGHPEAVPVGHVAGPYGQGHMTQDVALTAPLAVVSTPDAQESVQIPDSVARGFVIYVGLDEQAAHLSGTSLTRLAQQARAFVHQVVPSAQTHAAVALAPVDAPGSDLDVVRQALGDPTVSYRSGSQAPVAGHEQAAHRRRPAASQDVRGEPPRPAQRPVVTATGVLIDLARREVFLDGETLGLTYKEFELLHFLVDNSHRTVGRDELLESLWPSKVGAPNERTIDVHIRRLRTKLGRLSGAVRTVRGQGYRFYDHPEVVVWNAPEYSI